MPPRQLPNFRVSDDNQRKFEGWLTVEMVDKDRQILPVSEFVKFMDDLMDRGGPLIDSHSNRVVGKVLNWQMKIHPKTKTEGIYITAKVFDHNELDNEIWNKIKSGDYRGFSFGGAAEGKEFKNSSSGTVEVLRNIEPYEVSVVPSPANPESLIEEANLIAKTEKGGDLIGVAMALARQGKSENDIYNELRRSFKNQYHDDDYRGAAEMGIRMVETLQRHGKYKMEKEEIEKYIRMVGSEFNVYSKDGKLLGRHETKDEALAQLRAIEMNKQEFPMESFNEGYKAELEHSKTVGGDPIKIAQIVLDHLSEDVDYYSKLRQVESKKGVEYATCPKCGKFAYMETEGRSSRYVCPHCRYQSQWIKTPEFKSQKEGEAIAPPIDVALKKEDGEPMDPVQKPNDERPPKEWWDSCMSRMGDQYPEEERRAKVCGHIFFNILGGDRSRAKPDMFKSDGIRKSIKDAFDKFEAVSKSLGGSTMEKQDESASPLAEIKALLVKILEKLEGTPEKAVPQEEVEEMAKASPTKETAKLPKLPEDETTEKPVEPAETDKVKILEKSVETMVTKKFEELKKSLSTSETPRPSASEVKKSEEPLALRIAKGEVKPDPKEIFSS